MTPPPSTLRFVKMHGTGNDFVIVEADDAEVGPAGPWAALAPRLCDRHFGVGADGLVLVLPSETADRRMRIFNADGSEAEMCGNGIRCFVKHCLDSGIVERDGGEVSVETAAGVLMARAEFGDDGRVERVRVSMGRPSLEPSSAGVSVEQRAPVTALPVRLDSLNETVEVALVSMGNPHAVHFVQDAPAAYPLERVGPAVERHPLFANRTNFEVAQVLDRGHVRMRVWERGVGETLACGTGACAVAVAARVLDRVDERVRVDVPGGALEIEWDGEGEAWLTGPAAYVFTGELAGDWT